VYRARDLCSRQTVERGSTTESCVHGSKRGASASCAGVETCSSLPVVQVHPHSPTSNRERQGCVEDMNDAASVVPQCCVVNLQTMTTTTTTRQPQQESAQMEKMIDPSQSRQRHAVHCSEAQKHRHDWWQLAEDASSARTVHPCTALAPIRATRELRRR